MGLFHGIDGISCWNCACNGTDFFKYVGEESKYISELDFYNAVKVSSDYPTAENVRDKEMK